MSPIGRVFLVLNLGLAGAFVAFAGTYLQRADDWKTKHDTKVAAAAEEVAALKKDRKSLNDEVENFKRVNGQLTMTKNGLESKLDEAKKANEALQNRMASLEGSIKQATSHLGKIDTELAAARQDSTAAMNARIAAQKERDDAVSAKNAAEKALADANFKIKNREEQIQTQGAQLAQAGQTIREKEVLLDLVNRRYPSIFETLHPLVTGTVSRVGASGNLVTIALQSGAENLKSGARFAIFNATDGYKGEATVSEVDSSKKFCFARLTLKQGAIASGDSASTNLSASKSN